MTNENDLTFEGSNHGHPSNDEERMQGKEKPGTPQRPQDFLKLLATRALEALAQTPPDSYGKTSRSSKLGFETSKLHGLDQLLCFLFI